MYVQNVVVELAVIEAQDKIKKG